MGKKKQLGAALIEYGLLAGLISLIAITAVGEHGRKVRDIFLLGTNNLSDVNYQVAQTIPPQPDVTPPPPPPPSPCPATVSIDGQDYGVVQIGMQCWLSENLNVATPDSSCYANDQANCDTYGRLYPMVDPPARPAVEAYCPTDWHIAEDTDWFTLERELGMSEAELSYADWRTTGDVEEQIASFVSGGTNSSGLNLLPGGYTFAGTSYLKDKAVIMLSAGSSHWRYLRVDKEGVNRRNNIPEPRYSVYARCVTTRS